MTISAITKNKQQRPGQHQQQQTRNNNNNDSINNYTQETTITMTISVIANNKLQ